MRKAIAVCGLGNWGGIEVLAINYGIEDEVEWRYFDEEGTSVIQYDITGEQEDESEEMRAYFMVGEIKIYLDECVRV